MPLRCNATLLLFACLFLTLSHAASATTPPDAAPQVPEEEPLKWEAEGVIVVFESEAISSSTSMGRRQTVIPDLSSIPGVRGAKKTVSGNVKQLILPRSSNVRLTEKQKQFQRAAENLKNMYRLELEEGTDIESVVSSLNERSDVRYAEPDYIVHPAGIPNDPYFEDMWSLQNTGQNYYNNLHQEVSGTAGADIKWTEVYGTADFPTDEVVVAVIDTGVDYNHEDLVNQMWTNTAELNGVPGVDDDGNGYIDDIYGIDAIDVDTDPYDDLGHGTHCAGTIAAEGENNIGIIGVNPNAKIMALRFLGPKGGLASGGIECIMYAANHGAKVLSNSWGGGGFSQALQDAVTYANEQGAIFVAAAGNNGLHMSYYPASYRGSISVGSTKSDDTKSSFSNYSVTVDVMAPGTSILSLRAPDFMGWGIYPLDNKYLVLDGTSMATPHVAGLLSLMYAKYPNKPPYVYERALEATCDPIDAVPGNEPYAGMMGAGRINVQRALTYNDPVAFFGVIPNLGMVGMGNYRVIEGQVIPIGAKVVTWTHDMDNLSVHITSVTSGLDLTGASEFTIGTVNALSEYLVSDEVFQVTVNSSAQWGQNEYVEFELRQGATVLETRSMPIYMYDTQVRQFTVADIDGDGIMETIGARNNQIYCFDTTGNVRWIYESSSVTSMNAIDIVAGDFDGDGVDEVAALFSGLVSGGRIIALNGDGTLLDEGGNKDINSAWYLHVADVNGNGREDILMKDRGYNTLMAHNVIGLNTSVAGAGLIFNILTLEDGADISNPMIGDVDGDGINEIVIVEGKDGKNTLRVLTSTGQPKYTRELASGSNFVGLSALGDMDGDGTLEIICSAGNVKYIANAVTGEAFSGWPLATGFGQFALGDLDLDGDLEIVGVNEKTKRVFAYHHDGSPVQGFPVTDLGLFYNRNIAISDVNNDGYPDILYQTNRTRDSENGIEYYDIVARDRMGLMLHGYPITIDQSYSIEDDSFWYSFIQVEPGTPSYDGDSFGASILTLLDKGVKSVDTGFTFSETASDWSGSFNDGRHSATHRYASSDLQARFVAMQRSGYGSLEVQFHAKVYGLDQAGLTYSWDFNNDGTNDLVGNHPSPTYTYTGEGSYSVSLTVTNTAGESWTVTHSNHITVYPATGVEAAFSANVTSGDAPLTIHFTDESLNGVESWEWDFNNDGVVDSTEQNPSWQYETAGSFSVKLTVSSAGGGSDTLTKTNYITMNNLVSSDVIYVSHQGSNSAPYKTWDEAAHTLQAALDVAEAGDTIIIDDGVYTLPTDSAQMGLITVENITIKSRNGHGQTTLNGNEKGRILKIDLASNDEEQGVTIEGLTFTGGYEMNGAAIFVLDGTHTIRNCVFRNNTTVYMGSPFASAEAVIYAQDKCTVTIEDSLFENNRGYEGATCLAYGGFYNTGGMTADRCIFRNNETNEKGIATVARSVNIRNSLIYNNKGSRNLIYNVNHNFVIENCTIVNNETTQGAMYAPTVRNSIIYDNVGGNWDSNIVDDLNPFYFEFSHNLTPDPIVGTFTTGTITDAPVFVDAANEDYRLAVGSPGIDQGFTFTVDDFVDDWKMLIDFGDQNTFTAVDAQGRHWNNLHNLLSGYENGLVNAVDTNGVARGVNIFFSKNADKIITSAPNHDTATPPVTYPSTAQSDALAFPTTATINVEGLEVGNYYRLTAFGSSPTVGKETMYRILGDPSGPQDSTFYPMTPHDPASPAVELINVLSSDGVGNGNAIIQLYLMSSAYSNPNGSVVGVLELTKSLSVPRDPAPMTFWTDLEGQMRVFNSIPDIGAYEYHGNLAPTAKVSKDSESRVNRSITFDASASIDSDGTIANYGWDWNNDGVIDEQGAVLTQPTHTFTAEGFTEVRLVVTDNLGKTGETIFGFTVVGNVPDAASALSITSGTGLPVDLTWTDNSDNETGFRIERNRVRFPEIDFIVENNDPAVTYIVEPMVVDGVQYYDFGWTELSGADALTASAHSGSYHYPYQGDGVPRTPVVSASITPNFPEAGLYEISIWVPTNAAMPSNSLATQWADAMYFKVNSTVGSYNHYVDAADIGGSWTVVGVYDLDQGSSIEINSKNSLGRIVFDALRFRKLVEYETVSDVGAGVTTFSDATAVAGNTYEYRVVAFNNEGDGNASNTASVSIASASNAPVASIDSLSVSSGTAPLTVEVTGSATDDGSVVEYVWDFGDGYSGSIQRGASLTSVSFAYRYPGTYTLTLIAYDDEGYGSSPVTRTIEVLGSLPNAPTALSVTQTGGESVTLSWTDNATNETGFHIQRRVSGQTFADIGSVGVNGSSFVDTTILPMENYDYRVRAYNEHGASAWSNIFSFTTLDLRAPINLSTEVLSDRSIRLNWFGLAASATEYVIERRNQKLEIIVDNADNAKVNTTGTWTTSSSVAGFYGADYHYNRVSDDGEGTFRYLPGIVHETDYELSIWYCASATRDTSIPLTVQHVGGSTPLTVDQTINGNQWNVLGEYTMNADSYVELSSQGTTGYVIADAIRLRRGSETAWTTVATVPATLGNGQHTFSPEAAGSYYEYRIRAVAGALQGTSSSIIDVFVPSVRLDTPQLAATPQSDTQIRLSWNDLAIGEEGYKIERRPTTEANNVLLDNDSATGVSLVGGWATSTTVSGFEGVNYLNDVNATLGGSTVTWTPNITGEYQIYLKHGQTPRGSDRVPVTITHAGGTDTLYLNQSNVGTPLLEWDYRGLADGLDLTQVANAGSDTATWSAALAGTATLNGALRVRTPVTENVWAGSGSLGYTSGTYILEVDLRGWNVVGTTNDQWFQINFTQGNTTSLACGLILEQTASGLAFWGRAIGTNATDIGSAETPVKQYSNTESYVTLRLVADATNETYEIFYRDASTGEAFTSGGTGTLPSDRSMTSVRLRMSNSWDEAGEFIDIARIRVLNALPSDNVSFAWQNLGTYTLDGSSNIVLSNADAFGTVSVDALRLDENVAYAPWSPLVTLPADSTEYTDTGLTADTAYDYRAQAYSGGNASAWSPIVMARTNQSGMSAYDTWVAQYTWDVGDDNTAQGDPDKDGLINFAEYAMRLNPLDGQSNASLGVSTESQSSVDYLSLTFDRNRSATDVRIIVETSNDLSTWTPAFDFAAGSDVTTAGDVEVIYQDTDLQRIKVRTVLGNDPLFYRIRFTNE